MLKLSNPISATLFSFSLFTTVIFPGFQDYRDSTSGITSGTVHDSTALIKNFINEEAVFLYREAELEESGLSREAFMAGYMGYLELMQRKKIENTSFLTICDFSQSSGQKRMYIIDMENHRLVTQTYVAHGRNSGREYATRFSNKSRSHQSSLGFYITGNTYIGGHGLSLQLRGIESGINDKALSRRIVLHGSAYVGEKYLQRSKLLGRSFGCPAVPREICADIISTIKNGSCLFIYHPSKNYLEKSKILNG